MQGDTVTISEKHIDAAVEGAVPMWRALTPASVEAVRHTLRMGIAAYLLSVRDEELTELESEWMDYEDEGYLSPGPHVTWSTDGVWQVVILRDGVHRGECGLKPERFADKAGRCAAAMGHEHPHVYCNEQWSVVGVSRAGE